MNTVSSLQEGLMRAKAELKSNYSGFIETLLYIIYRDWIVKPGSTVIDIGAHQGLHTFRLADCVGTRGEVIAFEPIPSMAADLRAEIDRRYGTPNQIRVLTSAVSDHVGVTKFFLSEFLSRSSLHVLESSFVGSTKTISVPVTTLDQLLEEKLSTYVTLLKIDAEGAEYNILKGARKFFKHRGPLTMIEFSRAQMTAQGETTDAFFDLADELNYVFFNLDGTPFGREVSASEDICYMRLGAKRGHWFVDFLRDRAPEIVVRQLTRAGYLPDPVSGADQI
jgi:FkbM family methyltransferase